MKKALLIALLSVLVLVCAVSAQTNDFSGTWYLSFASMDGVNIINAADAGMDAEFILNADGTAVSTGYGESNEGTWVAGANGVTVTFEDTPSEMTYEDGYLYAKVEGGYMAFSREKPEPSFIMADPVEEPELSDFDGKWTPFMIGAKDMGYYDWQAMKSEFSWLGLENDYITIKDGVVDLFGTDEHFDFEFQDNGTLAFLNDDQDMSYMDAIITLHEDGRLTFDYIGITFVLDKVEED